MQALLLGSKTISSGGYAMELYLGKYQISQGKVALPGVTDYTSGKFTPVNFCSKVAKNNKKCPRQNPLLLQGSFGVPR